ncbi:glycosyltransferase [bacterium]|jgi:hypothetical protein|nr:glycosyltransferase [bacterium]
MIKTLKKYISSYLNTIKISNIFKSKYKKKALLSYVTIPFIKNSYSHSYYFEAQSWAKILDTLGYQVDVIHYDRRLKNIDTTQYDLICGFGSVFQKHFETPNSKAKTIYYATGMHAYHQNLLSLKRVKDVYVKKNVWLGKSARFVEKTWTHQTTLVNGIIALGGNVCADSYRKHYDGRVISVPAPFHTTQNVKEIINTKHKDSNKNFLWFGGSGFIHKGLDLLLDYFVKNVDLTLHVCGPIDDTSFVNAYKKELYETLNIITYGFIDIKSEVFTNTLKSCAFVIFPSCSEGGSVSVLTAIGNGALIPIITKETAISTGSEIWINNLDYHGIDEAIKNALKLKDNEIFLLQKKNYEFVALNNSKENYYNKLKLSILDVLGDME